MEYDSKKEHDFHLRNKDLVRDDNYLLDGFYFRDANGWSKKAKPDFIIERLDGSKVFVEYKAHHLNNIKDIQSSEVKEWKERRRLHLADWQPLHSKFQIENGWNHSLIKQAIVSKVMAQNEQDFIVIFDKNTKFGFGNGKEETKLAKDFKRLNESGLNWMLEEESYLWEFIRTGDYQEVVTDEDLEEPTHNAH